MTGNVSIKPQNGKPLNMDEERGEGSRITPGFMLLGQHGGCRPIRERSKNMKYLLKGKELSRLLLDLLSLRCPWCLWEEKLCSSGNPGFGAKEL